MGFIYSRVTRRTLRTGIGKYSGFHVRVSVRFGTLKEDYYYLNIGATTIAWVNEYSMVIIRVYPGSWGLLEVWDLRV